MIKLNLGAGDTEIEGYTPIDRKQGGEVYPLDSVDDASVDVIRASHVLEHFGHEQVADVLSHWVQKLQPGGCLKVAVPDFGWVAKNYVEGKPINVQGYVMGGHTDKDDWHGCVFDRESLKEALYKAGLERISGWESHVEDCTTLPVSLNLKGYKPSVDKVKMDRVAALLSAPRHGPVMHARCAFEAFAPIRLPYQICQGAYWHQVLCEQLEVLLKKDIEHVITCDYDTVFRCEDVVELYRLVKGYDVDAVCSTQQKRSSEHQLIGIVGDDGKPKDKVYAADFNRNLTQITTGHFGLTVFKAESLRRLPRPWMLPKPDKDGRWTDGRTDADISFWHNWNAEGFEVHLANRVVVGHLQEMITWPGRDMVPIHQYQADYETTGMPAQVDRLCQ